MLFHTFLATYGVLDQPFSLQPRALNAGTQSSGCVVFYLTTRLQATTLGLHSQIWNALSTRSAVDGGRPMSPNNMFRLDVKSFHFWTRTRTFNGALAGWINPNQNLVCLFNSRLLRFNFHRELGSIKPDSRRTAITASWRDILGSLWAPEFDPRGAGKTWTTCKYVVSHTGDICPKQSWVFFKCEASKVFKFYSCDRIHLELSSREPFS